MDPQQTIEHIIQDTDTTLKQLCDDCNLHNAILLDFVKAGILNISTITTFFKTNIDNNTVPIHVLEDMMMLNYTCATEATDSKEAILNIKLPNIKLPNIKLRQRPKNLRIVLFLKALHPKRW